LTLRPGLGYNRYGLGSVRQVNPVEERVMPFSVSPRSTGEPDPHAYRRREARDAERGGKTRRRARTRQRQAPWLQRHALSVAAVSILAAILGLGFGLLQMINRPEPSAALLAITQADQAALMSSGTVLTAATTGAPVALPAPVAGPLEVVPAAGERVREIQASTRVIEPNYTVAAGDTLGQIAARFNTTVERIQALNNLSDPRALRVGARLVIPPPL
jgi:hypothetical protein